MREFVKQIVTALKDDEWEMVRGAIRHIKSRLQIDLDLLQPIGVPYSFTWWERRVVSHHITKLHERMLTTKFVMYRINPKPPKAYASEDTFV